MEIEETRREYVLGLRALADLIESTPDLPLPTDREITWAVHRGLAGEGGDERERIAKLARLLPGRLDKNDPAKSGYNATYFEMSGKLHGLDLRVWAERSNVCRRVVTGQREVTKKVPTATEEVAVTEDIVEWVCEPLLASVVA